MGSRQQTSNGDDKPVVALTGFNPPFDTGILLGNGDGTVQTFTSAGGSRLWLLTDKFYSPP